MRRHQTTEDASINLTPMIDVVFLLVIFFMVGSRFDSGSSGVQVNVPGAGDFRSLSRLPDERIIEVGVGGRVRLDGQLVTMDQLTDTLRQQRQDYPGLRVAVRGDGDSSFQQVAEVLQRVSAAGVEQMGIAVRGLRR